MRVLITNSPLHYTHGHTLTQWDWQTLVLPALAGIVGNKHEIKLVDNINLLLKSNTIVRDVRTFKPDLVAFSIIAARDLYNTINVIREVRELFPNVFLIAGGQGGSFFDKELLENGIDVVVRGEGELTIPELIQAIEHKATDFSSIEGISFLRDGTLIRTPNRPKIKHLDDSPWPRFDLMPKRKSLWFPGRFTGSVETTRGCPFTCNFCAITSFWEATYRKKSPERIIEEMKLLVSQGRSHLYLADDNFGMGTKHHEELFKGILREGLDVKFFAQIRTDTIAEHPELIELAARAGFYGALIGFDTYDEETFHHIAKVGSVELNQKCADVMRKNRIMIFGSHIYGLPSQKKPQDFWKTFWKGRRNSDLFRMPHFSLLPGTKLFDDVITKDIIANIENKDDFRFLIRPKKEMKSFSRWCLFFNLLHVFLIDEILKAFLHSNKNVRILKRRGYIGIFRHYFYRFTRRLHLTDI